MQAEHRINKRSEKSILQLKTFIETKKKLIRWTIIPNNSKSLWDAVKLAKDLNVEALETIPTKMSVDDTEIKKEDLPQAFADYFRLKVEKFKGK